MNKFKPYTIGLISSILFHIPFFYFYWMIPESTNSKIILIDPAIVQCCIDSDSKKEHLSTWIKPPPITLPPRV